MKRGESIRDLVRMRNGYTFQNNHLTAKLAFPTFASSVCSSLDLRGKPRHLRLSSDTHFLYIARPLSTLLFQFRKNKGCSLCEEKGNNIP
jgi:hypothetical protein